MEDEQLSLKWNNHKASFFNILKFLREKSNYTDATLAVEGKFYPVHKLVMSTCSEYFSDIFEKTSCKSPVIVLKDVSSHDIEALLDYMYLGEVNVSQNKLASLLKTAESLRIKGLAVPDKDEAELSKNPTGSHDDVLRDCPPSKRRRHNSGNRSSHAAAPVSSPQKSASALVNHTDTPSISSHLTFNTKHDESPIGKVQMDDPQESITKKEEPPVVKLEVDDDVVEERFERENNYEGGASSDLDPLGDYGSDLSKTEHELDNYCSTSFPGPSLQHSGEGHWDEGDSSSFPPESYTGDISYQQGQGDVDWMHSPWARTSGSKTIVVSSEEAHLTRTIDIIQFISEVQLRPALWDKSSEEYSNRYLKMKNWEELVAIFLKKEEASSAEKNEFGRALQKRWRSLKDCYSRELRRMTKIKSGTSVPYRHQYIFYNQLSFLQGVIRSNRNNNSV